MNFLHVTTFYPPYSFGGDAMHIYRLSHALADLGHYVEVVHCRDSYHLLHPTAPEVEFPEHPGVVRRELRSRFGALSPLLSHQTGRPWLKGRLLRDVLRQRHFDVIHFHNISLLGPAVLWLDNAVGPSVKIYTTHEHWLICPMHVLWKFNRWPCEKPHCLPCVILGKRPPQLWRYTGLLQRAAQAVDQFVSPSRFTARMHAERGFPRPVAHLPYFIERRDSEWKDPGPRPQERPYFLFVGRLEKIKGLQTLIPLWRSLPEVDLLVAGTGTYEGELRKMAAAMPNVKFLGPLSQKQLGAFYVHAVAAIVPSITYETFGMISIEAFARKTPVIVRDLGALPEPVEDSGGGFVYRTDAELLAAVRRLAASPGLRDQLGEKGYQAFLEYWCTEAHLTQYFRFLREAAERKFGSVPWEENSRLSPVPSSLLAGREQTCRPS
ncbi:MAG: glycosyltransferase family 4 protein [Bryobacterales bacterium]|nr:glycosyltransferase family 4 protein [Bryobacteraceae bacterium]MDW8355901.1 glycosyltransferase family 4 protein [Bryobacterales bacterium]